MSVVKINIFIIIRGTSFILTSWIRRISDEMGKDNLIVIDSLLNLCDYSYLYFYSPFSVVFGWNYDVEKVMQ